MSGAKTENEDRGRDQESDVPQGGTASDEDGSWEETSEEEDARYPECDACGQPLPIDTSEWMHNIPDAASKLQRPPIDRSQRYQVWIELTRGLTKAEYIREANREGDIRVRRPFSMTMFAGAYPDEERANAQVDRLVKDPVFENFFVYAFDALYPVAFPLIESIGTDVKVHSSVVDNALRRNKDAAFREREALIDSVIAAGGRKGTLKYETRAGTTRTEPIPEKRGKGKKTRRFPKRKGGKPQIGAADPTKALDAPSPDKSAPEK